jgi:general nucleoside transport system permease protein
MDFLSVIAIIVQGTLFAAAPLIFTALGGVFSERSGVVNIGLEGLMVIGACTGITVTLLMQDTWLSATPWLAVLIAACIAGLVSLLHALASITLRADQVVSGVVINILAVGATIFAIKKIFDKGQTEQIKIRFDKLDMPVLSDIPVIGDLFFTSIPLTSYIAIGLAFVVWYIIYKTPFGLRLRAVGEHPMAADTMGINVVRMRYTAVFISGIFAGIGGAVYAISISGSFSVMTITGQGFLALAAMIFGKWHPIGALGAALFFGFAQSLSVTAGTIPGLDAIPQYVLYILPYVLTILALVGFVGRSQAPKALGTPYIKGKR